MNRREFFKSTGMVVGGLWAAPAVILMAKPVVAATAPVRGLTLMEFIKRHSAQNASIVACLSDDDEILMDARYLFEDLVNNLQTK